ncbi:uncharacterized protein CELE_B0035.22 [Caenorhabditis elegans]|uniref:Uncharacterized protein n=1 Tax=Caenorhabditis elegans TaxID=6239 RepID=A0A2K5ATV4_CAEEL|nr:Uncharacterized protein CELE_B0035.22 [Caenorhabditis elegans]SPC47642.1 Uncharacterized protein CELE_B0035.22 [Caenorhabditis elegans]|eukprot:NP_001348758.1 Uncharacterized protein CELE_B0035.22 [Caenorhabditis elegans]
MLFLRCFFN